MAIQTLIPGYNPGAELGTALGQGLGGLLEGLATNKAQQIQQQAIQQQRNEALRQAGYGPKDLALASLIPQQDLLKFLTSYQPVGQENNLQQAMQQLAPQQQITLQDLLGQQQPQNAIEQSVAKTPVNLQQLLGLPEQQEAAPQEVRRQKPGTFETPQQRLQRELVERKGEQAKEKELLKHELKSGEKSGEIAVGAISDLQAARDRLHDIEEYRALNKSDKLVNPLYYSALKRWGLDIPALLNPESEEALALQKNFLRDAKRYFGARVSNFEVGQFLKSIPTLSNSKEGRERILESLEYFEKSKRAYGKSLLDIYKKNPKIKPHELQIQAYDHSQKKIDKYADKFSKNMQELNTRVEQRFDTLPKASDFPGKRMRHNGKIYISENGKWKPENKKE